MTKKTILSAAVCIAMTSTVAVPAFAEQPKYEVKKMNVCSAVEMKEAAIGVENGTEQNEEILVTIMGTDENGNPVATLPAKQYLLKDLNLPDNGMVIQQKDGSCVTVTTKIK